MKGVFARSQPDSDSITSYFFEPQGKLDYTAGQYIELTMPIKNADERGSKRWFTLSSSPTEDLLRITTRNGLSNFKQQLKQLKPGSKVDISLPMGDFVIPIDLTIPLVFVAAGIGITPVRSIVKWLHDTNQTRPIQIMHVASNKSDFIFTSELSDMNVTHVLTTKTSKLTADLIYKTCGDLSGKLVYLSGPEVLVQDLQKMLIKEGLSSQNIITDEFLGYN